MRQLKDIIENKIITDLTKSFSPSPHQINKQHETDAEIINLNDSPYDLAITIDTISEEIKTGLYSDPYQIGWMSVMVNMSDLAAVGAFPIGIVVSQILPQNISKKFLEKLQQGIDNACKKCKTFVLGGDTNFGDELIISGCAIGTVGKTKHLSRIGCKPGDRIYASGKLGSGNAYAAQKLLLQNSKVDSRLRGNDILIFNPSAELEWRNILLKYSTSCIDTSDGVLSSLDQLMRLNNVGFVFQQDWIKALNSSAKQLFDKFNLPLWFLLAGEHGEFELLFSIPQKREKEFLKKVNQSGFKPIYLTRVVKDKKIKINVNGKEKFLDTKKIRNLSFDKNFSPQWYLQKLLEIDKKLRRT